MKWKDMISTQQVHVLVFISGAGFYRCVSYG